MQEGAITIYVKGHVYRVCEDVGTVYVDVRCQDDGGTTIEVRVEESDVGSLIHALKRRFGDTEVRVTPVRVRTERT